jgi:hypothetical protein
MNTPSNEFADNLFDQVLSIWVNPEIEKRKQAGVINDKFVFWAAQVIMDPSGPEQIRLNEEARGIFKVQNMADDSTVSLMTSKKHNYVLSKYNAYSKQGNTERRFAQLLNNLANLRNAARYPNGSFSVTQQQAEQMLEVAEEMFAVLMKSIPKRAQARLTE